jgi:RNA polymerase sigma-70 factor, ECF subfamily
VSDTRPDDTQAFARLIARARRHDEDAVAALYQRALPIIYRYVLARCGRTDMAEDIVSDVFLTMVESIQDLRAEHEGGFFAWLVRIASIKVGRALEQRSRDVVRLRPLPDREEEQMPSRGIAATGLEYDPQALQEWREIMAELGVALGTLTDEQQIVIIGRFLAGQSIEDLARALEKQPGAIRALQFRALGQLAEQMGQRRTPRRRKGGRV